MSTPATATPIFEPAYRGHPSKSRVKRLVRLALLTTLTWLLLLAFVGSASAIVPPPSFLSNASFELSMVGSAWFACNEPLSVGYVGYGDINLAHEGLSYLDVDTSTAHGSIAQDIAVVPAAGSSYNFSAWVRSKANASVSGSLCLWALGGTQESASTYFTVGPKWTLVSVPLDVADSGHTGLRAEIYMDTVNTQYAVDGAQLVYTPLVDASFEHFYVGDDWFKCNNPS